MTESAIKQKHFIREWREARGVKLDELADAVGMDKGNLSKIERGLMRYNQDQIEAISQRLGIDVATILGRSPSDPSPIWSYIAKAKPNVRRQIEAAAEAIFKASGGE